MPKYRAPKIHSNMGTDPVIGTLVAAITLGNSGGHQICLQIVPIRTGFFSEDERHSMCHVKLYNHERPCLKYLQTAPRSLILPIACFIIMPAPKQDLQYIATASSTLTDFMRLRGHFGQFR